MSKLKKAVKNLYPCSTWEAFAAFDNFKIFSIPALSIPTVSLGPQLKAIETLNRYDLWAGQRNPFDGLNNKLIEPFAKWGQLFPTPHKAIFDNYRLFTNNSFSSFETVANKVNELATKVQSLTFSDLEDEELIKKGVNEIVQQSIDSGQNFIELYNFAVLFLDVTKNPIVRIIFFAMIEILFTVLVIPEINEFKSVQSYNQHTIEYGLQFNQELARSKHESVPVYQHYNGKVKNTNLSKDEWVCVSGSKANKMKLVMFKYDADGTPSFGWVRSKHLTKTEPMKLPFIGWYIGTKEEDYEE